MYKIDAVHFHLLGTKLMVFMQRQRMKDLLLRALIHVVETSKRKIWRRRLADDVKKLHKKRATHAAQLFFLIH